jgi:hypothetical protein
MIFVMIFGIYVLFFVLCAKANFAQYDGLTCHPEQIPPRFSAGCVEVLRNEAC